MEKSFVLSVILENTERGLVYIWHYIDIIDPDSKNKNVIPELEINVDSWPHILCLAFLDTQETQGQRNLPTDSCKEDRMISIVEYVNVSFKSVQYKVDTQETQGQRKW